MALTATTNTTANTAIRYLRQNDAAASSSLAKLSSGSRIVKSSDDAASLAVGTKIKADVTALKQAAVNASQASSLLQVADGGMSRISDILQRMKALATQSQSGSVTDAERLCNTLAIESRVIGIEPGHRAVEAGSFVSPSEWRTSSTAPRSH